MVLGSSEGCLFSGIKSGQRQAVLLQAFSSTSNVTLKVDSSTPFAVLTHCARRATIVAAMNN